MEPRIQFHQVWFFKRKKKFSKGEGTEYRPFHDLRSLPEGSRPVPLAENMFLQAGQGAEITKEKSRQCFTTLELLLKVKPASSNLIFSNRNRNQ
jgi:hypothetical protein